MPALFQGLRFGMVLQLAIGPICLFIFQTAVGGGLLHAETGVVATALVDGLEILLAVLGVGVMIKKSERARQFLKWFGFAVLSAYGITSLLSALGLLLLPNLHLQALANAESVFVRTLLLALSDPLTIVFWAGVFSAKINQEQFGKRELVFFGAGCVAATLLFLSAVSLFGSFAGRAIPEAAIRICHFVVGLMMLFFAFKSVHKRSRKK